MGGPACVVGDGIGCGRRRGVMCAEQRLNEAGGSAGSPTPSLARPQRPTSASKHTPMWPPRAALRCHSALALRLHQSVNYTKPGASADLWPSASEEEA